MSHAGNPCNAVRELLLRQGAPTLPAHLREHIAACARCAELTGGVDGWLEQRRQQSTEPMPNLPKERIWQQIRADLPSTKRRAPRLLPNRWLRPAFAGTALAAAATIVLWVQSTPTSGQAGSQLLACKGEVQVHDAVGLRLAAPVAQDPLRVDDVVVTGAGHATGSLIGGAWAALEHSEIELQGLAPGKIRMAVRRGGIAAEVSRRPSGQTPQMQIALPRATVSVIGTGFWVETTPTHDLIAVWQGTVQVTTGQDPPRTVRAGEALLVTDTDLKSTALEPARLKHVASILGTDTGSQEPATAQRDQHEARTPSPRVNRASRAHRGAVDETQEPTAATLLDSQLQLRDCSKAISTLRVYRKTASPSSVADYRVRIADCFYAAGDRQAALEQHHKLIKSQPGSAAAANSRYEIGRILWEKGDSEGALNAFRSFVGRHPRSLLAPEARYRVCAVHMEAERYDALLDCVGAYRRHHPKGRRRQETHLMEATALRAGRGDCIAAILAYERYLSQPGDHAAKARQWRDWCKAQVASAP